MRTLQFVIAWAALVAGILPAPVAAQQRTTSALQVGDQVKLKVRGVRFAVEGAVSVNSRDTIVVLEDPREAPVVVAWNNVTRAQQGLGHSPFAGLLRGTRRGAITGAIVGLMVTPFIVAGCHDASGSTSCTEVVLGTLGVTTGFGGAVGGVLGLATGAERWRELGLDSPPRTTTARQGVPAHRAFR